MKTSDLSLPSGLKVQIRALTLEDDSVIFENNDPEALYFEVCLGMLDACTLKVLDEGPYQGVVVDGKINWRKALLGDVMAAFFGLRIVSYAKGKDYPLDFTCPFCGEYVHWEADLRTIENGGDIIDYPLDAEVAELIAAGRHPCVEIDEHVIDFRLQTVEDFLYVQKLPSASKKEIRALSFIRRMVDIIGPSIKNPNDRGRWLRHMDNNQAMILQDAMSDADPGVDSSVDVTCPGCHKESEVTIPFDQYFFIPRDAQKRKRANRKAQLRELRREKSSS